MIFYYQRGYFMSLNPINIGDALFTASGLAPSAVKAPKAREELSALDCNLQEAISITSDKLFQSHGIKGTDINQISIGGSRITYYLTDQNQTEVSYSIPKELAQKINKFAKGLLVFQRDSVGETILKVSKDEQFGSIYLYSSGGGGHKAAKEAQMERDFASLMQNVQVALQQDGTMNIDVSLSPSDANKYKSLMNDDRLKNPAKFSEWCKQMGLVKDIDVLHEYLGSVGEWASSEWDKAQVAGDVEKQESLASKQWLSDLFFGPVIFIYTLISLIKLKPKQIVSTQAMATPSILNAVKLYNSYFKPKQDPIVKLHLYMTDMPTEYAIHFFNSLKTISVHGGKEFLVLHAPKPEEEADWEKLCGLQKEQVKELDVKELPVRLEFLKAIDEFKPNLEHPSVQLKVSDKQELQLLHEVIQHQGGHVSELGDPSKEGAQFLDYGMKPEDKGTFIMLGSQPTKSAIEGYVQEYLALAKENPTTHYNLFAFAGKFEKDKDCFYKELAAYIKEQPHWPPNLRVIPLSFQTPKQLVGLEMTCDSITRSGGATVMELLVLNEIYKKYPEIPPRKRLIHAQPVEGRTLEDSIPLWEKGNYLFLKKKAGATVVDPQHLRAALGEA